MVFNQTLPKALANLPEGIRPVVRHQTGKKNLEVTQKAYNEAGVEAELLPFIDDMASVYDWADVVLCRAGALTVSELAIAGVPALLVPFPYAVDDHQTANARYLADNMAARLIPQSTMNEQTLADLLREFCENPQQGRETLLDMANSARKLAMPESTAMVVEACLSPVKEENAA
jgi:UDP-N-acetylglucosamine--N-acetylmuramyl-(pentapeptide) pyrophosphoryl-undecaprenol N-acetylglucosamine transferase